MLQYAKLMYKGKINQSNQQQVLQEIVICWYMLLLPSMINSIKHLQILNKFKLNVPSNEFDFIYRYIRHIK